MNMYEVKYPDKQEWEEVSESDSAEKNPIVVELIFLFFIIVLTMVSGIFYLILAPGMSERSDIHQEVLGIYIRHKMKLEQLSKKYYDELGSGQQEHSIDR